MLSKKILLIIIFFLLIPVSFSQYYADIDIVVESDGRVSVDGITNLNYLNQIQGSQLYTNKEKTLWTLNITTEENFDDFIFELSLPKYSEINYLKTTPTFRILDENNHIKIIGTGENKPLTIVIQYEIHNISGTFSNYYLVIFSVILILGVSLFLRSRGFRLEKIENSKKLEDEESDLNYDHSILPQRQKDIIDLLSKNKKMTQKEIEENMSIPKSSVSRNIKTLEIKGIIKKEQAGKVNYLSLNK